MMRKMLIAATLASLSCSALATDQLIVNNQSDLYSTALVNGVCYTGAQVFTKPNSTDKLSWTTVQMLCGAVSGNCTADVYVTDAHDCTTFTQNVNKKNVKITTATMDLATGYITPPTASQSGYTMTSPSNFNIIFTGHAA